MKNISPPCSQQSGFTLLEVVIAMAILLIGILGTSTLLYRVTGNNTMANLTTQANYLAVSQMESLKHTANLTTLANGNDIVNANGNIVAGGNFTRTWAITNPVGNSRFITVTVVAQSGMGQRTIVLTSLTQGDGI